MNTIEAARRLGVGEFQVTAIRELDAGGHVVTLRSGHLMLVSQTTARAFVPEVDEPEVEQEAETAEVEEKSEPAEKPKAAKKTTAAKGRSGSGS